MRKRETESVSFPRQCLKGEVIFRQWPPIKISRVPTSRHPSLHCCERRWSVCPCTQHTLSTELIMLIGSQTFPHITISFLSKLLFKVTAPSAFSITIFDILDIYVYFRLMFVFLCYKVANWVCFRFVFTSKICCVEHLSIFISINKADLKSFISSLCKNRRTVTNADQFQNLRI